MRQHVNPLSNYFKEIDPIPDLNSVFSNPKLPLHIDIGSANGYFLNNLACLNKNWNYLGIEIRKKLVINAIAKLKTDNLTNLFFVHGNAYKLINDYVEQFPEFSIKSISFNFPDPWFKKKHHKRRIIQPNIIYLLSNIMHSGSLISIKTDVQELFSFMDSIILNSQKFKKINSQEFFLKDFYNPNNIKTCREIYALKKQLIIYQSNYEKI